MKTVVIKDIEYEVIKDDDLLDVEELKEKLTDYFDTFDYILGDQSYNKLRLKGFYESSNKNKKDINDIKGLENYIKNYCAYGCKTFLLKKWEKKN
ncbi:MAG TPA: DUF1027 domain-containing protein [Bacilli bacterium]|nr:DUF1027 domain-containing protein [Bacilli bacterium]